MGWRTSRIIKPWTMVPLEQAETERANIVHTATRRRREQKVRGKEGDDCHLSDMREDRICEGALVTLAD